MSHVYEPRGFGRGLETAAAWLLGLLWILPLVYAVWTAFHPGEFSTRFVLTAPLTLENFVKAWQAAPFARYLVNTVLLVTMVLAAQLVLVTLAAYAFARFEFPGRGVLFALVLVQLMIMPDVLIVENYRTMNLLGLKDTIVAIGLPYVASAFGIFLLRQTFMSMARGYFLFTGTNSFLSSSMGACKETASATGLLAFNCSICGTRPEVDNVTRRFDKP